MPDVMLSGCRIFLAMEKQARRASAGDKGGQGSVVGPPDRLFCLTE